MTMFNFRPLKASLPALALGATLLLAGCGFQLRGSHALPFDTVFVTGDASSSLGRTLRQRIEAGGTTRIADTRLTASATLDIVSSRREKSIISLTGAGKVREYRLIQTLRYRLLDRKGQELAPSTEISASREMTYDDELILAKNQEETLLYRDIEKDLTDQLLRRLETLKRPD